MPTFTIISPLDQPKGKKRLMGQLKACFQCPDFYSFTFVTAFSKVGALLRLKNEIEKWKTKSKSVVGYFGIDHFGTSTQALSFALEHFTQTYYVHVPQQSTFHPKVYAFVGKKRAKVFIGSNNMTVGGLETNFETTIEMDFTLPAEATQFREIDKIFEELLPENCIASSKLTPNRLNKLIESGMLCDETQKSSAVKQTLSRVAKKKQEKFTIKPPSSLPAAYFGKSPSQKQLKQQFQVVAAQATAIELDKKLIPVSGFAIQIKPHHNGEIFLSQTAAKQNPAFFGMPFSGQTTPKKSSNPTYPQRIPDPICHITVYGRNDEILFEDKKYNLNTIFYTKKKEIRITASPLVGVAPEYSLLLMYPADSPDLDYSMDILTPDNPRYSAWLQVCNQTMPSGGKEPRKFGWF